MRLLFIACAFLMTAGSYNMASAHHRLYKCVSKNKATGKKYYSRGYKRYTSAKRQSNRLCKKNTKKNSNCTKPRCWKKKYRRRGGGHGGSNGPNPFPGNGWPGKPQGEGR